MYIVKPAPRGRNQAGYTLIELLVAMVILAIIVLPLGNVVLSYFLNSSTTSARISETHDEQIAAAYWQQDVASLGVRSTTFASGTFPLQTSVNTSIGCSLAGLGTVVVTLAWNQYTSAGVGSLVGVAYIMQNSTTLIRVHCSNGSLDSNATIARSLTATPQCDFGSGLGACASGTGTPATIGLYLSVHDPSGKGQAYTVTLNGQRRQT
jgi:prepilin-type N-terminal cleavage/methylation domain-containing protein